MYFKCNYRKNTVIGFCKSLLYNGYGGEGGIRTHGTVPAHTLSRRARSTTPAPLRKKGIPNI